MNKTIIVICAILNLLVVTYVRANTAKLINPVNNHVYQRFDVPATWGKAKTSCANKGGYLATITSQAENDWLYNNNVIKNRWLFLGASDSENEGQWKWITGEEWNYTNWHSGEPNNQRNEDYLTMNIDGSWNDGKASSTPLAYLCEWDKLLKTYTQMVISDSNSDGSDEFVLIGNDGFVNKIVAIDRQNKSVISEIDFLAYPEYRGVSLNVADDMNGNNAAEFVLLMTKKLDGSSVIETRDSVTGKLIESYAVPR